MYHSIHYSRSIQWWTISLDSIENAMIMLKKLLTLAIIKERARYWQKTEIKKGFSVPGLNSREERHELTLLAPNFTVPVINGEKGKNFLPAFLWTGQLADLSLGLECESSESELTSQVSVAPFHATLTLISIRSRSRWLSHITITGSSFYRRLKTFDTQPMLWRQARHYTTVKTLTNYAN
jgi:hypothetical protein